MVACRPVAGGFGAVPPDDQHRPDVAVERAGQAADFKHGRAGAPPGADQQGDRGQGGGHGENPRQRRYGEIKVQVRLSVA